jgi:polysaccharide export outer membrane protein
MRYIFTALLIGAFFCSCINTRRATYFNDLPDTASYRQLAVPEVIIRRNDVLSINVSSPNPDASRLFNLSNNPQVRSSTPTGDQIEPAGYLVDKDGNVRFLMLGVIKAEGRTRKQLQEEIRNALIDRKLLLEPVVEIRLLNFKVTVLGEVTRPTVITVPNERITLLEALGLAGDLTIFAKRNNVLVIREEDDGVRTTKKLDLGSTELFNSPYYYLRSNDVVYVEPNRARVASATRVTQLLPVIISALTASVLILDRLFR